MAMIYLREDYTVKAPTLKTSPTVGGTILGKEPVFNFEQEEPGDKVKTEENKSNESKIYSNPDSERSWLGTRWQKVCGNYREKYGYYDAIDIQNNTGKIIKLNDNDEFILDIDELRTTDKNDKNFYEAFLARAVDVANKYVKAKKTFPSFKEFEKAVFAKKDKFAEKVEGEYPINNQYKDIKKLKEDGQAIDVLNAVYKQFQDLNLQVDKVQKTASNNENQTVYYRNEAKLDEHNKQAEKEKNLNRIISKMMDKGYTTDVKMTAEYKEYLSNADVRKEFKNFYNSGLLTEKEKRFLNENYNLSWGDDQYSKNDPKLKFYMELKKRQDLLDNNIKASDGLSYEYLTKHGLSDTLIEKLSHCKNDDDGTYNLSKVGEALKNAIGADVKWNTYGDGGRSEADEVKSCELKDLTDKDIEQLMDFFGIEKETNKNNVFTKGYKEALFGGTATAIAGAFARVDITQVVNVVNGLVNEVVAEQMVRVAAGPLAGLAIPISLALNTVGNLLFDEGKGEQTCFKYERILDDYIKSEKTDLDEFQKDLENCKYDYNSNQQKAMLLLASLLEKKYGPDWVNKMKEVLDKAAGNSPVLNCEEFAAIIPQLENELNKQPDYVEPPVVPVVTDDISIEPPELGYKKAYTANEKQITKIYKSGNRTQWANIAAVYNKDCSFVKMLNEQVCDKNKLRRVPLHDDTLKVRALKLANAINAKYDDKGLISELIIWSYTDKTKNGVNAIAEKYGIDFDWNEWIKFRDGNQIGDVKIPYNLAGCTTTDDNINNIEIVESKDKRKKDFKFANSNSKQQSQYEVKTIIDGEEIGVYYPKTQSDYNSLINEAENRKFVKQYENK